jgi:hypothetical protein
MYCERRSLLRKAFQPSCKALISGHDFRRQESHFSYSFHALGIESEKLAE